MLKHKALLYAIFSFILPLAAYAFVFLVTGPAFDQDNRGRMCVVLLVSHAAGLILSVMALIRSDESPVNMSRGVLIAVFLGSVGMLANVIALEILFTVYSNSHIATG